MSPPGRGRARRSARSGSGEEVEGVGQLVGRVRVPAGEVGVLVADVGDDLVALLFDVGAGAALVGDGAQGRAGRLEDDRVPLVVALRTEVVLGVRRLASPPPVMKKTAMPLAIASL